jgi:putative phage-type endonuclease
VSAPQGSESWLQERLGKVTASRIADVVATTKSGWGASRANYMAQLVAERVSGRITEAYANAAMQHGTEAEPRARAAYSAQTGVIVDLCGFIPHPEIDGAGASPDGLVEEDGLVEIKCPNTATHIDTLLGSGVDSKYALQMQWQMACTGRKWCDFVSFDDRLPEHLALHVRRVHRDEARISGLEELVRKFLSEVAEKVSALSNLKVAA